VPPDPKLEVARVSSGRVVENPDLSAGPPLSMFLQDELDLIGGQHKGIYLCTSIPCAHRSQQQSSTMLMCCERQTAALLIVVRAHGTVREDKGSLQFHAYMGALGFPKDNCTQCIGSNRPGSAAHSCVSCSDHNTPLREETECLHSL
jgi:hypothetical protein